MPMREVVESSKSGRRSRKIGVALIEGKRNILLSGRGNLFYEGQGAGCRGFGGGVKNTSEAVGHICRGEGLPIVKGDPFP